MIGGAPYLDPEGEITGFSANALAGDIVYALKSGRNELTFKYLSSAGNSEPVTLGTATKDTTGVSFTSVTGKEACGAKRGWHIHRGAGYPRCVGVPLYAGAACQHFDGARKLSRCSFAERGFWLHGLLAH